MRFPGQYYDRETSLAYNYFRDYDPAIGRYIQSDPIGLDGGNNTYLYVDGDPLSVTDQFGMQVLPSSLPAGKSDASQNACEAPNNYIKNFCGSAFAVPNKFPGGVNVNSACRIHDQCYGTLGSDREICDLQFYNNMASACQNSTSRNACLAAAGVYGVAVRAFGGGPYSDTQSQMRRSNQYVQRLLRGNGG